MPTATTPMFVSLDPGPTITALVLHYKRRLRELVGDQMFLNDPPHLTVYLAHFASKSRVVQVAAELATESGAIDINIVGWHVFTNDQLTGGHTLVLQFDEFTQSQLRTFQKRAIDRLAPLRDRQATTARYIPQFQLLSTKRRESVEEIGFPFTGADWHPHFTVASIRRADWAPVAAEILPNSPRVAESCGRITVYQLENSEPQMVVSYSLNRHKVAA
jgi:2'-5' RNA ligase